MIEDMFQLIGTPQGIEHVRAQLKACLNTVKSVGQIQVMVEIFNGTTTLKGILLDDIWSSTI